MPESTLPALPDDHLPAPVRDLSGHPVAVYLARLAPGSRRAQMTALETMARALTNDRQGAHELPWGLLGYQPHQRPAYMAG